MKNTSRRRIILIDKKFQYGLIVRFVVLNIAIMAIFGCLIYLFLNSELESNLLSAHVTYHNIKDMLLPIVLTLSVLNIVFSTIVTAAYILFASHRIAGPLYRFTAAVDEMAGRNFSVVSKIRDGDQLLECSVSLGGLISTVSKDIGKARDIAVELESLVKKDRSNRKTADAVARLRDILDAYTLD